MLLYASFSKAETRAFFRNFLAWNNKKEKENIFFFSFKGIIFAAT